MTQPLLKLVTPDDGTDLQQDIALGDGEMDSHHREFLALAQHVATAPAEELAPALFSLFQHTQLHFDTEESQMQSINHGLLAEHRADHQRILGDMERFYQRAEAGRGTMARAWVRENLMDWFSTHVKTMDSALAANLSVENDTEQNDVE